MIYSLDERQIAKLKPLALGHTAARFIELPTRWNKTKPWDKVSPDSPGRRPGARPDHDGRGLRPQAERRVKP